MTELLVVLTAVHVLRLAYDFVTERRRARESALSHSRMVHALERTGALEAWRRDHYQFGVKRYLGEDWDRGLYGDTPEEQSREFFKSLVESEPRWRD